MAWNDGEGEVPSEPQVRMRFIADGIVPGLWFGEHEHEHERGFSTTDGHGITRIEGGCCVAGRAKFHLSRYRFAAWREPRPKIVGCV